MENNRFRNQGQGPRPDNRFCSCLAANKLIIAAIRLVLFLSNLRGKVLLRLVKLLALLMSYVLIGIALRKVGVINK